ncbi:MAG: coenzyme F420-0:L-glutamate ligase [Patescibacteria group bacterium]|jgi:F420-0:gamma-glutamyl ligase
MQFIPVKTRPIMPPQDNIYPILDKYLPRLKEGDILLVTSKILGIHQGRCVKIKEETRKEKDRLIIKEADYYISRREVPNEYAFLTIKDNTLISSAGIDKSNSKGYYVFWPKNTNKLLREIWRHLKKGHKIKKLGVIAVDSHSLPLRFGTLGISIGFFGIKPVKDYRGRLDIFGRPLHVTRANVVDALAAIGVSLMGESNEQTPLLIARSADFIEFTDKDSYRQLIIPRQKDMFYPLLKKFKKVK